MIGKNNNTGNDRGRSKYIVEWVIGSILFTLSCVLLGISNWYSTTFDIAFQELLYTLAAPLDGSNMSIVKDCLAAVFPWLCIAVEFALIGALLCFIQGQGSVVVGLRIFHRQYKWNIFTFFRHFMTMFAVVALWGTIQCVYDSFKIGDYLALALDSTTIYEDHYVDPADTAITAPKKRKNLIYIYIWKVWRLRMPPTLRAVSNLRTISPT